MILWCSMEIRIFWNVQVRQILERHLVVGQELSINNLTSQGRDNYLQTIRGKVKIVFVENGGGKFDLISIWFRYRSTLAKFYIDDLCQFIRLLTKRMEGSQREVTTWTTQRILFRLEQLL